jgi:hypothetical protein
VTIRSCPHCGDELPSTIDPFCPYCQQDLDELPEVLPPAPLPPQAKTIGQHRVAAAFDAWHYLKIWAILIVCPTIAFIDALDGKLTLTLALWAVVSLLILLETFRRAFRPPKNSN